jgi:hypothetical protein
LWCFKCIVSTRKPYSALLGLIPKLRQMMTEQIMTELKDVVTRSEEYYDGKHIWP